MNWLFQSIAEHPTTWTVGSAYFFLAAVNALPEPGSNRPFSELLYQWVFDFLHVLSNRVARKYPPPTPPTSVTMQVTPAQTQIIPQPGA